MSAEFDHHSYTYTLHLAPTRFLYYAAVQQNLWRPELRQLRQHAFENALLGLDHGETLILPSTFAIHMAVISSDGMALLRRRTQNTPLYPGAWEAGVGEFMHGPGRKPFRHFDSRGKPSLSLFLKSAVSEELNFNKARNDDFVIFGLAAEYRTLGPKLLVAYFSDAPIGVLRKGAQVAPDSTDQVTAVKFTVEGIANAIVDAISHMGPYIQACTPVGPNAPFWFEGHTRTHGTKDRRTNCTLTKKGPL